MFDYQKRYISVLICLAILVVEWLIWSGIYQPLLLALGAFSCGLSAYLAHRVGFFREESGLYIIPRLPFYWAAISVEIIRSSFEVARIILNPKLPISPTVIEMDAEPQGPIGQATLGNAITLSPGTVTLDIYDGRLQVHCLTREGAQDLLSSNTNRLAAALTSS